MKQLAEEQYLLCQQYLSMVSGIEEGFAYVTASFTDFSKTEGDLVLSDILQALATITYSNTLLERLLEDDEFVQQAIKNFQDVTDTAFKLDGHFDHYEIKMKIITDFLYPDFTVWKDVIRNALSKYVSQ